MSDLLGLSDEIAQDNKRSKWLHVRRAALGSLIVVGTLTGVVYAATLPTTKPSNDTASTTTEQTTPKTDTDTPAPVDATVQSQATPPQSQAPSPNTSSSSAVRAQMDNQNLQLRRQWVGDALKAASDYYQYSSLLSNPTDVSIKQAYDQQWSLLNKAINLGILQGVPDAQETQLKQTAVATAKQAALMYGDAEGYIQDSCIGQNQSATLCQTGKDKLKQANELNAQFSQQIQVVKAYQGW